MIGHTNISPSYSMEDASDDDFRKVGSLYKAVRNQLSKDEKLFVYPPRSGTLRRISRGKGHIKVIKHEPSMDIVAAMVIEYPRAKNDNFGLSRRLVSEFERCSVLRSYVTSYQHRNKGIGRTLVTEWIRQSLADNRPYCITEVVQGNNSSFKILRELGFRDFKRAVHPHDLARTHLLIFNAEQPSDPIPEIFK